MKLLILAGAVAATMVAPLSHDPSNMRMKAFTPGMSVSGVQKSAGEYFSVIHCSANGFYHNVFVPYYGRPRYVPIFLGHELEARWKGKQTKLVCL